MNFKKFSTVFVLFRLSFVLAADDFYSFSVADINGKSVSLERYRGKVTLVVNVASECGFTDKHYKGLVKAKNILGRDGNFEILGFPCNQFGAQEPKSNEKIMEFAKSTYDINFPLFSKINVLEEDVPGAWQFLIEKTNEPPSWNFWKYLITPDGQVSNSWGPWSDVEEIFPVVKAAIDAISKQGGQMPSGRGGPPSPPRDRGSVRPPAKVPANPPARAPVRGGGHEDL